MLPEEFIEYSKKFEVGFLCVVGEKGPDIRLVRFKVDTRGIAFEGEELDEGRACLAFANEEYVWASENASVNGRLEETDSGYVLVPEIAVWTIGFETEDWPRRIVKRWRA